MHDRLDGIPWAKRLKLRHLEVFLLLDDTGSITAAAAALHLTQPAVSHWLTDVEEVVGMKLFVRGRKLRLTPSGEIFKGYALRALGDVQRTDREFAQLKAGGQGRVHIGTILSAAMVFLPSAIEHFRHQYPGVAIEVSEGGFAALIERMERREIDFLLGPLDSRAPTTRFASVLLRREDTVAVARPGHPILRGRASWKAAADCAWILPPAGSLTRATFEQSTLQARIRTPEPVIETSSLNTQQALLATGDYLALMTRSMAEFQEGQGLLKIVRLPLIRNTIPLGAIWDEQVLRPAARHFVELLGRDFQA